MQIQDLQQLIQQLAKSNGNSEAEITEALAKYAQMRFDDSVTVAQRKIIDGAKEKVLLKMYAMRDHTYVTKRPDFQGVLGFDKLEMAVIENVGNELEAEGLLEGNENYSRLTEKGALEAKKLRGEL